MRIRKSFSLMLNSRNEEILYNISFEIVNYYNFWRPIEIVAAQEQCVQQLLLNLLNVKSKLTDSSAAAFCDTIIIVWEI